MLGWGRGSSDGSLYPALKKMLRASLILMETLTTKTPGTPVSKRPRITSPGDRGGHGRVSSA